MNAEPKGMPGREDLTPAELELSQLVFHHYHPNPKPGGRSRVSDDFARNLRGDTACLMRMATLIARMVSPEHERQIGRVNGFLVSPKVTIQEGDPFPEAMSLGDILANIFKEPKITTDDLVNSELRSPLTGEIQPLVLWAHAFKLLQGAYSDVVFDHEYAEVEDDVFRPAINGDGINVMSVNGAILKVLDDANAMDSIDYSWLASEQDEDGWVFAANPDA